MKDSLGEFYSKPGNLIVFYYDRHDTPNNISQFLLRLKKLHPNNEVVAIPSGTSLEDVSLEDLEAMLIRVRKSSRRAQGGSKYEH